MSVWRESPCEACNQSGDLVCERCDVKTLLGWLVVVETLQGALSTLVTDGSHGEGAELGYSRRGRAARRKPGWTGCRRQPHTPASEE